MYLSPHPLNNSASLYTLQKSICVYLFVGLVLEVTTLCGEQDDKVQLEFNSGPGISVFDESVPLHIFTDFVSMV